MAKFILLILLTLSFFACGNDAETTKGFRIIKHTYYKSGTKLNTALYSSNADGTRFTQEIRKSDGTIKSETREFKTVGNDIKILILDKNRDTKGYIVQQYKPKSKIIMKRMVYGEKDKLISYTTYIYYKDNRLKEKINYNSKNRLNGFSFFFDKKGRIVMDKFYKSGIFKIKTLNEYNSRDNISKITKYNLEGKLLSKRIYIYDKNQNIIENSSYNKNNIVTSKIISYYNTNNNRTEVLYYGKSGLKLSIKFKKIFLYNMDNNLIKVDTYSNKNNLLSSGIYKYDTKGNKIRQSYFNALGKLTGFSTYDYD